MSSAAERGLYPGPVRRGGAVTLEELFMIDLKPAAEQMITLVDAVPTDRPTDRLAGPTPCAQYRIRDLVAHIDSVSAGFAAAARKQVGEPEPLEFDGAWKPRVGAHVADLASAWADPAAWDGLGDLAGLALPNEVWGKIALSELVVHAWDLARSIGQPVDLPDDTLRSCLDHVADFVPTAPIPQLWGSAVVVVDDAPLLDRIVAITGRTP